jgi:hypothetical protein
VVHPGQQGDPRQGIYRVDRHDPIIERSESSGPKTARKGWCYTGPGAAA